MLSVGAKVGTAFIGLGVMWTEGDEVGPTSVRESFAGFYGDAAVGEAKCFLGLG